jgi:hypothetical protein
MRNMLTFALATMLILSLPAATPIQGYDTPVTGSLAQGDSEPIPPNSTRSNASYLRDVYSFEATQGQLLDASVFADFDCYLLLFGPDGSLLAENDDDTSTTSSRVTVPSSQAGTHYVVITSFAQGVTGTYTLTVKQPRQAPAPSVDTPIALGQTLPGNLADNDYAQVPPSSDYNAYSYYRDGYVYQSMPGEAVDFTLNCQFDGYLLLVDASGTIISENDDFGSVNSSRVGTSSSPGGPLRVIVTSFSAGVVGTYSLTVTAGAPPRADAPISFGQPISGNLMPGANAALTGEKSGMDYYRDGYVFEGSPGTTVTVSLTNAMFDAYLYLVDPSGNILAFNDDHTDTSNSQIVHTLNQSGPHRIVVTSLFEGLSGSYMLTLSSGAGAAVGSQGMTQGMMQGTMQQSIPMPPTTN